LHDILNAYLHLTGEPYAPALSFYNEQVANPSVSSASLLVGRAVVRILRGELSAAQSDLEEAEAVLSRAQCELGTYDMLAAMVVAASLGSGKKGDVDELWRYVPLPCEIP
jgi:coatomer protein complex subunit epsilon